MAQRLSEARVPLLDESGHARTVVRIIAPPDDPPPFAIMEVGPQEARDWGEERVQLLEGRVYDYEAPLPVGGLGLRSGVVKRSGLSEPHIERGTIRPQTHTGLLPLVLEDRA